jgi:hypothetical protein
VAKPKTTPPKSAPLPTAQTGPGPQILDALTRIRDGAPPPASVAGAQFQPPGFAPERAPTPPHSATLVICRSPGGFILYALDASENELSLCHFHNADAVAGTAPALAAQVTAWATAPEFPA